jgi:hypothetical protein
VVSEGWLSMRQVSGALIGERWLLLVTGDVSGDRYIGTQIVAENTSCWGGWL